MLAADAKSGRFDLGRLHSGFAGTKRGIMVIGQIFLDESMSRTPYVSAGWVSEKHRWEEFSVQWASALATGKPLPYFKLSHARLLRGGFDGWTEEERDGKLRHLASVIPHDSSLRGVGAYMRTADFEQVARPHLKRIYKIPYYFEMAVIMLKAADWFADFDKIDFILDRDDCKHAERMRRLFYSSLKPLHPRFGECFTLSDTDTMPLQAADMLAGLVRQMYEPLPDFLPAASLLKGVETQVIELDKPMLRRLIAERTFRPSESDFIAKPQR